MRKTKGVLVTKNVVSNQEGFSCESLFLLR